MAVVTLPRDYGFFLVFRRIAFVALWLRLPCPVPLRNQVELEIKLGRLGLDLCRLRRATKTTVPGRPNQSDAPYRFDTCFPGRSTNPAETFNSATRSGLAVIRGLKLRAGQRTRPHSTV